MPDGACRMKGRVVLIGLSLSLLTALVAGNDKQQGEELIEEAIQLSSLQASDSPPYRLRMHVRSIAQEGTREGTFLEVWASKKQWRRETRFPGFSQIDIGDDEKRWVLRDAASVAGRLMAVPRLFQSKLKLSPDTEISPIRDQQWKGEDLRCVVTKQTHSAATYCFESNAALLRTIQQGRVLYEYADYAAAGTKKFPRTFRVWNGEQLSLEATTEELEVGITPDPQMFVAPAGAVAWANCDDVVAPRPRRTPDPTYPMPERKARQQGVVLLYTVIGGDGHTHDIAVLESPSPGLGTAAMAAVAKWQFTPAMCHGTPAAYEMSVEVSFRLY